MAAVLVTDLPAAMVMFAVQNADGTWPNRPTSRTDVLVLWIRIVAGSADPTAVTAPALNGAYDHDVTVGA